MRIAKYLDSKGMTAETCRDKLQESREAEYLSSSSSPQQSDEAEAPVPKTSEPAAAVVDPDETERSDDSYCEGKDMEVKPENVTQEDGTLKQLEEYLTFGELAGRIPTSLLPKIDFHTFAKNNNLPALDDQAVTSI